MTIRLSQYTVGKFFIYDAEGFMIGEAHQVDNNRVRLVDLNITARTALGQVLLWDKMSAEYFDHGDVPSIIKIGERIAKMEHKLMARVFRRQQQRIHIRRETIQFWGTEDLDQAYEWDLLAGQVEVIGVCDVIDTMGPHQNVMEYITEQGWHYYAAPRLQYSEVIARKEAAQAGKTTVVVEDLS